MIGLVIAGMVGYFWAAVCVGTIQFDRYAARGYTSDGDDFSSFCAGVLWPITILVWTAKGTARWL